MASVDRIKRHMLRMQPRMSRMARDRKEIKQVWHLFDAQNQTVGGLAARIATLLQGKNKPTYTSNYDDGDTVVVVNCERAQFTGRKWKQKEYFTHSGYPGSAKFTPAWMIRQKHPERILEHAVSGMLQRNKFRKQRMLRLKVYAGLEHPHLAQFPQQPKIELPIEDYDVAALDRDPELVPDELWDEPEQHRMYGYPGPGKMYVYTQEELDDPNIVVKEPYILDKLKTKNR